MKDLLEEDIQQQDVLEYLKDIPDIDFELATVRRLRGLLARVQHGGTYIDPFKQIPRQFDIRARVSVYKRGIDYDLLLAIECKNLRKCAPLVVHTMPAGTDGWRVPVVYSCSHTDEIGDLRGFVADQSESRIVHIDSSKQIYRGIKSVGKAMAQIGRKKKDGPIIASDSDVYDKWSQAVNSAIAWLQTDSKNCYHPNYDKGIVCALPVLVVPNHTLWEARYHGTGRRVGRPRRVDRLVYFLGLNGTAGGTSRHGEYSTPLLEIVTSDGLLRLIKENFLPGKLPATFPRRVAEAELENAILSE